MCVFVCVCNTLIQTLERISKIALGAQLDASTLDSATPALCKPTSRIVPLPDPLTSLLRGRSLSHTHSPCPPPLPPPLPLPPQRTLFLSFPLPLLSRIPSHTLSPSSALTFLSFLHLTMSFSTSLFSTSFFVLLFRKHSPIMPCFVVQQMFF